MKLFPVQVGLWEPCPHGRQSVGSAPGGAIGKYTSSTIGRTEQADLICRDKNLLDRATALMS
jgi:hypothetical protein